MNEDMKKRLAGMLSYVWEVIGGDILTVQEEMGEGNTCTREVVMEVCSDASLDMYGKEKDAEAYKFFRENVKWKSPEWNELMLEAFPYEHYGW